MANFNPYSAPLAVGSPNVERKARVGAIWPIRGFAVLHAILAVFFLFCGVMMLLGGFWELERLGEQGLFKSSEESSPFTSPSLLSAELKLACGCVLCSLACGGAVLVYGFWRLRLWSRWAGIVQLGLFELALGGLMALSSFFENDVSAEDTLFLLPGAVLAAIHLLLWLPRFSRIYASAESSFE